MAFIQLKSAAIAVRKAIKQELINRIRLNFDNHESRLSSIEVAASSSGFKVGEIRLLTGSTLPDGFLYCDGSEVSKTTYSELWAFYGSHVYGTPSDPTNNFLIPDYRGRAIVGTDNMNNSVGTGGGDAGRVTSAGSGIDGDTLGDDGGSETVTISTTTLATHSHTINDSGHTHSLTDGGHAHDYQYGSGTGINYVPKTANVALGSEAGHVQSNTTGIAIASGTTGISTQATGSGGAHNNIPPAAVVNVVIRYET